MPHGVKAVKYIGMATIRRISDTDWAAIAVTGQDTTIWTAGNGYTVLGERFKPSAIDYFKDDDEFILVYEESTA